MYLCRKHTSSSLKFIGDEYGGRDHSTVIHAISVVEDESKLDLSLKRAIEEIQVSLKG
jgi:chromosomal replication initiator protein